MELDLVPSKLCDERGRGEQLGCGEDVVDFWDFILGVLLLLHSAKDTEEPPVLRLSLFLR